MAEQTDTTLDYDWLDELLENELQAMAEDLEAGGKVSPTDFARLVEFHRENYPPNRGAAEVEWRDGWNEAPDLIS